LLPTTTKFAALPESGFFLDYNTSVSGGQAYGELMRWTVSAMNGTLSLPSSCLAAFPNDPAMCVFAENISPTIKSPVFVLNSQYDYVQIPWILDNKTTAAGNAWGERFVTTLQTNLLSQNAQHGAFIDSCWRHCWYGGGWGPSTQGNHINGTQTATAFATWYSELGNPGPQKFWLQCKECYPCKACCG